MCADAATYVRLNKIIAVPSEKVPEDFKQMLGQGWIGAEEFIFLDKNGNVAKVKIDYDQVSSIPKARGWEQKSDQFRQELVNAGFTRIDRFQAAPAEVRNLVNLMEMYKIQVEQKAKETKTSQFDF